MEGVVIVRWGRDKWALVAQNGWSAGARDCVVRLHTETPASTFAGEVAGEGDIALAACRTT